MLLCLGCLDQLVVVKCLVQFVDGLTVGACARGACARASRRSIWFSLAAVLGERLEGKAIQCYSIE